MYIFSYRPKKFRVWRCRLGIYTDLFLYLKKIKTLFIAQSQPNIGVLEPFYGLYNS